MGFKLDIKKIAISMLLSLVFVTILSSFISSSFDVPVIKTGPAFVLLLISIFITYLFVVAQDRKVDKTEIFGMLIIAVALVISGWAIKEYFPSIFSAFPSETQDLFTAWGVK